MNLGKTGNQRPYIPYIIVSEHLLVKLFGIIGRPIKWKYLCTVFCTLLMLYCL